MPDPITVAFWVGSPAVLLGCFVSLRSIFRSVSGFVKTISALAALADHELNHNSGSSTKDAAFAAANAAAEAVDLGKKAVEISQANHNQFTAFLIENNREKSDMWLAIHDRKAV